MNYASSLLKCSMSSYNNNSKMLMRLRHSGGLTAVACDQTACQTQD